MIELRQAADLRARIASRLSLDEAHEIVVEEVREAFPIVRSSVRMLDPDRPHLMAVAAIWSRVPTALRKGMRISTAATTFPSVVRAGRAVVVEETSEKRLPTFEDEVLRQQGIRSLVSVPLREGGRVSGLLTFSSTTPRAFETGDGPWFDEVGAACEDALTWLARVELCVAEPAPRNHPAA